jgi:hypothetical protein
MAQRFGLACLGETTRTGWPNKTPRSPAPWGRIRATIKERIETGTHQEKKALVQSLVADVRVESRDEIYPIFRIPDSVRVVYGMVDPRGFEPLTF